MITEEKARAYDEALERARKCLDEKRDTCFVRPDVIFPELAESEEERIRKAIICGMNALKDQKKETFAAIPIDDCITWLEKQGNTANKVEPKFKAGDWITFYGGEPFKILKVESEQNGILDYLLLSQNGHDSYYNKKYVDENARLWTIQDAKDGDVLYYKDDELEWILIYKNIILTKSYNVPHDVLKYYVLFTGTDFYDSGIAGMISENYASCFTPATKEQCDALMKAMDVSGYKWDAEKKELRKMEQKPKWTQEDEERLQSCINTLQGKGLMGGVDTINTKWLKSIKQRMKEYQ